MVRIHAVIVLLHWILVAQGYGQDRLPDSELLTADGDLSAQMVAGIDRYLTRATAASVVRRTQFWNRDFTSPEHYAKSVEPQRARFRNIIGAVEELTVPVVLSYDAGPDRLAEIAELRRRTGSTR